MTKRLLGGLEAWGADESSLPIHLAAASMKGCCISERADPRVRKRRNPRAAASPRSQTVGCGSTHD
ncbi:hypothetical protein ABZ387_02690 [Streptomyces flaveolus]|uniref:hypothetical protein n=1 Tax=Streptomyces flaveolus TaxID=67297 RepID=UPI0033EB5B91